MVVIKLNLYWSIESSHKEPTFHVLTVNSHFPLMFLYDDFYKCFGFVVMKRILYYEMFTESNKKFH